MDTSPQHIAFIMDGNRRWAKNKFLSFLLGHKEGTKRIEPLVAHAAKAGITHLTFWAFSTENWKRDQKEVSYLMDVFRSALKDPMVKRLQENGVQVRVIGDITKFPEDIQQNIQTIIQDSMSNNRIIVNFALNYGGRQEILQAVTELIKVGPYSKDRPLTEEDIEKHLYTYGQPDPDLIIRTGGEQRLSGYLPWQGVYSELYFTETLWPDFTPDQLDVALADYATRQRRFGK